MSRGPPLDRWEEFLDPEGRVTNPERVKELVFRGVRIVALADLKRQNSNVCVFTTFSLSLTGRRPVSPEGGVEVPAGLLPLEQHRHGAGGHPAPQDVGALITQLLLAAQAAAGANAVCVFVCVRAHV